MRSVELPEPVDLEGLGPRELGRALSELDQVRRRVEALIAEVVGEAERTVAYAEDGHANPQLLDRTAALRRFDALLAIFTAAAASGVVGVFDPLVNLVVDQATFEHHLTRLAGGDPQPLDPATVDQRRCETVPGHQIDPSDMLAAVLTGHVRRVVFAAAGVVIDLGRRSRLFTGSARDAVLLGDRWCLWPGCDLRSGRCQTDHTTPWATDGPTRPDNGGIACARHNRWKQHGYRTWRDPQGRWHTNRPDGTEIGCLADAQSRSNVSGV